MTEQEQRFVGGAPQRPSAEERLAVLEAHIEQDGGWALRQPPDPSPDSFAGRIKAAQDQKRAENIAAAEAAVAAARAERKREAAEAAAELQRQHQLYRDNAGRRQRALLAINELEPRITKAHESYLELRDQKSALLDVVNVGIPPNEGDGK